MTNSQPDERPGFKLIYTTYITLKNGKRIFAASYGLKAFAIWVRV